LTIERQVKEVLAGNLGKPPGAIRLEDDLLVDLGLDSLSLAELTVHIEQLAGGRFAGEDLMDANTVGDLVRLVSRKLETQQV
jgi:acyl carrier protein